MKDLSERISGLYFNVQLPHYLIISVTVVCISLYLGIFGGSFFSRAQSDVNTESNKYFTSIMVKPGDTLSSIAGQYADDRHYTSVEDYIEEVRTTNNLHKDDILPGDYLIIPYYSSELR